MVKPIKQTDSEVAKILRDTIVAHIRDNNGLVTAPEKLIAAQITALARWLQQNISEYEEQEMYDEALALKDILNRL
jgi:hypothetical protein